MQCRPVCEKANYNGQIQLRGRSLQENATVTIVEVILLICGGFWPHKINCVGLKKCYSYDCHEQYCDDFLKPPRQPSQNKFLICNDFKKQLVAIYNPLKMISMF